MTDTHQKDASFDPLLGREIDGKYRIVRLCGRGGMGSVYEGINIAIGKRLALKFIDPEVASNQDGIERFLREARAASAAESSHIVQVFDVSQRRDQAAYIVMEFLRGEDLGARLRRVGRLGLDETLHIAIQTLQGLRRAHEVGIVHRDLKPDNVFLVDADDDPSFVKIVDFGISKITERKVTTLEPKTLTQKGMVLGTPFYMSPEQAQGLTNLDGRADLWAVGAMLFQCLTGKAPFGGDTYEQVIIAICTTDAPRVKSLVPDMPSCLADVIDKSLHRSLACRFSSAEEFIEALRGATQSSPSKGQDSVQQTLQLSSIPLHAQPAPELRDTVAAPKTGSTWSAGLPSDNDDAASEASVPAQGKGLRRPDIARRAKVAILLAAPTLAIAWFVARLGVPSQRPDVQANAGTTIDVDSVRTTADASAPIVSSPVSTASTPEPMPSTTGTMRAPLTQASAAAKPTTQSSVPSGRRMVTKVPRGGIASDLELKTDMQ